MVRSSIYYAISAFKRGLIFTKNTIYSALGVPRYS